MALNNERREEIIKDIAQLLIVIAKCHEANKNLNEWIKNLKNLSEKDKTQAIEKINQEVATLNKVADTNSKYSLVTSESFENDIAQLIDEHRAQIELNEKRIAQNELMLDYLTDQVRNKKDSNDVILKKDVVKNLKETKNPSYFITDCELIFNDVLQYELEFYAEAYPAKGQKWTGLPPKGFSDTSSTIADNGNLVRHYERINCFRKYEKKISVRIEQISDQHEKKALENLLTQDVDEDNFLAYKSKLNIQPSITSEKSKNIISDFTRDLDIIESNVSLTKYAQYITILDSYIATIESHIFWLRLIRFANNENLVNSKVTQFEKLISDINTSKALENINKIPLFIDKLPAYLQNTAVTQHRNDSKTKLTRSEAIVSDLMFDLKMTASDGDLKKYYDYQTALIPIVRMISKQLLWLNFYWLFSFGEKSTMLLNAKYNAFTALLAAINRVDILNPSQFKTNTLATWKQTHNAEIKMHRFDASDSTTKTKSELILTELDNALEKLEGPSSSLTIN